MPFCASSAEGYLKCYATYFISPDHYHQLQGILEVLQKTLFRSSNTLLNPQSKMSCRVPYWYKYHIDSLRFDTQSTDCPSNPSKISPLIAEDTGAAHRKTTETKSTYDCHGKNAGDFSPPQSTVTTENGLDDAQGPHICKLTFGWNALSWLAGLTCIKLEQRLAVRNSLLPMIY